MYQCQRCEEVFNEPMIKADETCGVIDACPYCSSSEVTEIYVCKVCGERFSEDDICEVCRESIQEDLYELKNKYSFTEGENEWMFDEILMGILEG
jgi:DNA-directed RNA polymerase subunit RPC12/RpoP